MHTFLNIMSVLAFLWFFACWFITETWEGVFHFSFYRMV